MVALALILFAGGLDTEWERVRPILKEGLLLATMGVVITALVVGLFARALLRCAICGSTDLVLGLPAP